MIERIRLGDKEIILVGTAHISQNSVEEVRKTIETEKPDIVGVELDEQRLKQLQMGEAWRELNVMQLVQSGQTYLFLLNLFLASLQRQLGEKFGIKPGAEMREALEVSAKQGIPIALLDRPVNISFKRSLDAMSLVEKLKLAGSLILGVFSEKEELTKERIEELKKADVLNNVLKELGEKAPGIKKGMVDERDEFIASRIARAPGKKIVAVVGAGHVLGLKEKLKEIGKGKKIDENALLQVPKKRSWWKYIAYAIPVLFFALLAFAFYGKGWETGLEAIGMWILITGACSAIGALVARAHWTAIAAAFLGAPIATLHPALASGWISGLVEARVRTPKVKDFEALSRLQSLNDFSQNNVTHILLVAALTNVGAMVGVVIAFPYIAQLIF
ncbi:MAG: TraB/GumN family protein [Candidatus Diapherotrites archaeon]